LSHPNYILSLLDPQVLKAMSAHLAVTRLEFGHVVAEPHETIRRVYFPHSGILSCVVETRGGGAIETGMIGKDGVFGALQALDERVSLNRVVVQIDGEASVIEPGKLRQIAMEMPKALDVLMRYEHFFLAQVQQTAACNGLHTVRQKLSRWLLRMHGLAGPDLRLTQEFVANMLGVRRSSVNDVAKDLQAAGLIAYRRGQIRILDLNGVRAAACECEEDLLAHHDRLFNPAIHEEG
jgi:CRP-like cAMP-binding protein